MAAIVWHGVQSHLESQLVESRTLRLRLPSPPQPINDLAFNSCFRDSNNINKTDTIQDKPNKSSGWSFLEALSNVSQVNKEPSQKEETTPYVHPQQKRSSLVLSPKSLEICTENLGNESGTTDIVENNDIDMLSSLNCGGGNVETREQRQPRQTLTAKKARTKNFPPPLTTIRGSESLRVRPHREDGRLVIEITKVPHSVPFFQAERSHGRLRLCFLKNHTQSFDPEEEEDDVTEENEPTTNEGFEEDFESEMIEQTQEHVEEEEGEEKKGNDEMMRMEKLERPRRCKESGDHENNELLLKNWGESLWVATS